MGKLKSSSPLFRSGPPAQIGFPHENIISFLISRIEGDIFDLGGGVGAYAHALIERGYKVTVGEKDLNCISKLAEAKIPYIDMNTIDSVELEGRFDTVLLLEVLEHVEDFSIFLKQAVKYSKKKILLTVPCNDEFHHLFQYGLTFNHIAVSDHLHQFTSEEIGDLMNSMGVKYSISVGDYLFPSAIIWMITDLMKKNFLFRMCLIPLRILCKMKILPNFFPTRIYVEVIIN